MSTERNEVGNCVKCYTQTPAPFSEDACCRAFQKACASCGGASHRVEGDELCPECSAHGPFEQWLIGWSPAHAPDPNQRRCHGCGHAWKIPEYHAWKAHMEEHHAEEIERAKRTVRYYGAPPVREACPGEGVRIYAKESGPTLRAVPNVTVLILPAGQVGVVTEKNASKVMVDAVTETANEVAASFGEGAQWDEEKANELHTRLLMWLRRQWTIGRIRRSDDGTWDLLPAVREA